MLARTPDLADLIHLPGITGTPGPFADARSSGPKLLESSSNVLMATVEKGGRRPNKIVPKILINNKTVLCVLPAM